MKLYLTIYRRKGLWAFAGSVKRVAISGKPVVFSCSSGRFQLQFRSFSVAVQPINYSGGLWLTRLYFLRAARSLSCGIPKTLAPFAPVIVGAATIAFTIASSVACTAA